MNNKYIEDFEKLYSILYKTMGNYSNFGDYDIIYIGYPIWWSDMPQIIYTFLESYNFDDKIIIPFSTHGGSGLAGTVNKIEEKLTRSTVIPNAFTISRDIMEKAPDEVKTWLDEIGTLKPVEN